MSTQGPDQAPTPPPGPPVSPGADPSGPVDLAVREVIVSVDLDPTWSEWLDEPRSPPPSPLDAREPLVERVEERDPAVVAAVEDHFERCR